jgi:hypothetical protein
MALDEDYFDLSDEAENAAYFGCLEPGTGPWPEYSDPLPRLRVAALAEVGSRAVVAAQIGPFKDPVLPMVGCLLDSGRLGQDMLLSVGEGYLDLPLWHKAQATGAGIVWNLGPGYTVDFLKGLPDGSYMAEIRDGAGRVGSPGPAKARVIEYFLEGFDHEDPENCVRLATNLEDIQSYPAAELSAVYHRHHKIADLYREVRVGVPVYRAALRSKTPELVLQEAWGLIIAHFSICELLSGRDRGQAGQAPNFLKSVKVKARAN